MKLRNGFVSNSSSEAFILNTNKSVEEVESNLRLLLDTHNKITGEGREFTDVFDDYIHVFCDSDMHLANWSQWKWTKNHEGKIIVYSAGDNTIPWGMMDYICDLFDAERIHLG